LDKHILVPIADGCEEMEAVTIIDTLRRAGGQVTVAGVDSREVAASRGVKLVADCLLDDCLAESYDLIVLPGGMPGAQHLHDSEALAQLLAQQVREGKLYAAICAAPAVVLQPHGFLAGRRATCHPSFQEHLGDRSYADERVVIDGNCVTSQGPGTALEFALALVRLLYGQKKAAAVAAPMIVP